MVTSGKPLIITFKTKTYVRRTIPFRNIPRPGHADFTSFIKYSSQDDDFGNREITGGAFFSDV